MSSFENYKNLIYEKSLRNLNYTEFVMKMLDDRHNIESQVRHKATAFYANYRGYRDDFYVGTPLLKDVLGPEPVSTTLDFSVQRLDDIRFTGATVTPEDLSQIFVHPEPGDSHDISEYGNLVKRLPLGSTEDIVRSFLPEFIRGEVGSEELVKGLSAFSPEKDEVVEFVAPGSNFIATIRFTTLETFNDSIETLEITNTALHPSGATIGTRLKITESLNGRIVESKQKSQHVSQSMEIEAQKDSRKPIVTVEDIFAEAGRIVTVAIPTKKHIASINDAVKVLKRARP